jgi:hypothetical protein
MIFDPKVGPSIKWGKVARRQEGGKEIMSDTVKQTNKKKQLGNVNWRPEKDHLYPEVKAAKERACDYVWNTAVHHPFL